VRFFIFKIYGLAILLASAINLNAQDLIVDDCNGNSNQNKLGYFWYFFDDHLDSGNSSIPGVTKDAIGSYVVKPTDGAGYEKGGIVLPYSLGPTMGGIPPSYNYVGMGTMLCGNGQSLDLTGATAISFWLKCDKAISIDFQLIDNVSITDFAYYYVTCTILAGTWTQFVIPLAQGGLGGLSQYSWTTKPLVTLSKSIKTISRLQWQISLTGVGANKSGTVTIDDIIIKNGNSNISDECLTCVGAPGKKPFPAALLSDMDTFPYERNARGYYWYSYSDGAGRNVPASDFSSITGGAIINAVDPTLSTILIGPNADPSLNWVKGYNGTNGADIQFTLGKSFAKVGSSPFVGVGTELWNDAAQSGAYNAAADNVVGVYFDYMLSGADSLMVVRLEVYANDFSINGEVHYIDLPYTGPGVWKGATVQFSKLVLPQWNGVVPVALDVTQLKKLQWTVQDAPGTTGEVAIDNVYFLVARIIFPISAKPIKFRRNPVNAMDGISTSIINGALRINVTQEISNASVTLVNTMGSVVARGASGVDQTSHMNVAGLAHGVYMLNVKATKSGNEFNQTMPVTIY